MPSHELAPALAALVDLENQAAAQMKKAEKESVRVYEWRPTGPPELPCIWNWIDDGQYEIIDTGRADDLLIVVATIGVQPSDLTETMGQLIRLTDIFKRVVDPALDEHLPLKNTVREAKRVIFRTKIEEFGQIPVMCMDLLVRLKLTASIRPAG